MSFFFRSQSAEALRPLAERNRNLSAFASYPAFTDSLLRPIRL
jgi:hypothetical protein